MMADDPHGKAISAAIYDGMVAYTKEHKRIFRRDAKINGRCFLVAVDAFNKRMREGEEQVDLIDDEDSHIETGTAHEAP